MSLFDTCFGDYQSAGDILKQLPADWGQPREDAVAMAAQGGNVPYFNRQWVEVPVSGGGHKGVLYVTPDYFSLGTDVDFVRTPMGPVTAEAIGRLIGGRLPTKKMVDDIHRAAPQKLTPDTMPASGQMMSTRYFVEHNAKVQAQFNSKGYKLGALTSGHKKDVVVRSTMDGNHVCIYGWFRGADPSTAIQGPKPNCTSHVLLYSDYSHGIRYVKNTMLVDGKTMSTEAVMRDPVMHLLVSDEGPFKRTSYTTGNIPSMPPTGQVATALIFFGLGFLGYDVILDLLS